MDRAAFREYILESYHAGNDRPFSKFPGYEVFRHPANKKWFAVVMDLPREKLGLSGEGIIDVVNLKCDPRVIGDFRMKEGFFPAYHMQKDAWITAALDGMVSEADLKVLVDMSFEATGVKRKGRKVQA